MSRYVDIEGDWVDDAIKAYSLGYYEYDEYAIPIERFGSAPSIDIVRCRECVWYGRDNTEDYYCMYARGLCDADADCFCSYGKRKGE